MIVKKVSFNWTRLFLSVNFIFSKFYIFFFFSWFCEVHAYEKYVYSDE